MPISDVTALPLVLHTINSVTPVSILDVGCGFGKYGFLLREILDWEYFYGSDCQGQWKTKIDAVEIWEPYITDIHRLVYNEIFIGDIRELIHKLNTYDVIIIADVIEHFEKSEGRELLNNLLEHTNKLLVITTPSYFFSQGTCFNNPFEEHKSLWSSGDFLAFEHSMVKVVDNLVLCAFVFKDGNYAMIPNQRRKIWFGGIVEQGLIRLLGIRAGAKIFQKLRRVKRRLSTSIPFRSK